MGSKTRSSDAAVSRVSSVRSHPVGRHREAQLLPQAGGGAAAGHPAAADLHQRRATQPHDRTVRTTSDLRPPTSSWSPEVAVSNISLVSSPQASCDIAAERQRGVRQRERGRRALLHPLLPGLSRGGAALQVQHLLWGHLCCLNSEAPLSNCPPSSSDTTPWSPSTGSWSRSLRSTSDLAAAPRWRFTMKRKWSR